MNEINEYLFSIAYMETAVSKLLTTEAERIRIFAQNGSSVQQMIETNSSINKHLKKLEQLHLHLANKFGQIAPALDVQDE